MAHFKGIHHISVLAGDPKTNVEFYTKTLGMRMVKKSVNQDDPGTYHLFYANHHADSGSSITFFPWPNVVQGKPGTGEAVSVAFQAAENSKRFWEKRLKEKQITFSEINVFGYNGFSFNDPDGLLLKIIFQGEAQPPAEHIHYEVPHEYSIQGFWGAKLKLSKKDDTVNILKELFDFEKVNEERNLSLYQTNAPIGHSLIIETADEEFGKNGRGIIHHIAFRTKDKEELDKLRIKVLEWGLAPTQIIDRHWFNSVYFREPGGVLFEMASDDPGYAVDEEFTQLGEKLILPPWLESKRERIEQILPEL